MRRLTLFVFYVLTSMATAIAMQNKSKPKIQVTALRAVTCILGFKPLVAVIFRYLRRAKHDANSYI